MVYEKWAFSFLKWKLIGTMMATRPPNLRAARTSLPIPKARDTRGYQPLGSCSWVLGTVLSRPDVALRPALCPGSRYGAHLTAPIAQAQWRGAGRARRWVREGQSERWELKWPGGALMGEQHAGEEPEPAHSFCSWPCCGRRWLCHGWGAASRPWTAATRQTQGLLVGTASQWGVKKGQRNPHSHFSGILHL